MEMPLSCKSAADAADYAGHFVITKLEMFLNPLPVVKELLITWNDTVATEAHLEVNKRS